MTSLKLLEAMGTIRDEYVLESCGAETRARKRRSSRRALLIAAVISLTLLLLGCTAVLLRLGDLKLGSEPSAYRESGSDDLLSMQGYAGTPNYQAAQEWMEFLQGYDPDGKLFEEAAEGNCVFDPAGLFAEYAAYDCYTTEMTEKVDEICEKYGLQNLGLGYLANSSKSVRNVLQALGIDYLVSEDTEVETGLYSIDYYRDGSFYLYLDLQLTAPGNPWPYRTGITYHSVMKISFDDSFLHVDDIGNFDQWNYTVKDGTKVLLALGEKTALIFADKETHFVSIHISVDSADRPEGVTMDRAALEAIADVFTFDYTPHKPTSDVLVRSNPNPPLAEDVPKSDPKELDLQAAPDILTSDYVPENEAERKLQQVLQNEAPFYFFNEDTESYLGDYCERKGKETNSPLRITRYAFVDLDGDGTRDVVVNFSSGETETAMYVLLRYDSVVYGYEFNSLWLSRLQEDGTFVSMGDSWTRLRWTNSTDTPVFDIIEKSENSVQDAPWYSYPITPSE